MAGCQKEKLVPEAGTVEQENDHLQAQPRAYEQDVCGLVEKFCSTRERALPANIGSDIIKLQINNTSYQAFPIKIYDGSVGIFVIEGDNAYVMHENNNPKLSQKNTAHNLPEELGILLAIDYQNNYNKGNIYSRIEQETGKSFTINASGHKEMDISDAPGNSLTNFEVVFFCNFALVSKSQDFLEVFYGSSSNQTMYDIIEAAFTEAGCQAAYSDYYEGDAFRNCSNTCIDPRCIVDYLTNLNEGLSDYQKHVIIARYLSETIGLTDDEQTWLEAPSNTVFARSIYDGFTVDRGVDRCTGTDCGILGGYHEAIIQRRGGEVLTTQETEGLLDFFSVMRCDDGEIYKCFRNAQKNPDSEVAAFLNSVKAEVMMDDFALLDECNNVVEYAERWADLGTFDALSVTQVSDRLNELGDDNYWIQTLENAQPSTIPVPSISYPYPKFWVYTPAVNMDFFGLNIQSLPLNPEVFPSVPFESAGSFLEFIRREFLSEEFYGEGSPCTTANGLLRYFEYYEPSDQPRWLVSDPVSTMFSIILPDDGSVICSKYIPENSWTFSTLNVPGWGVDGARDGYHPVSGNREFGLLENSDGTYTFYTSGVDRVTGWWHALAEPTAFRKGSEFWVCFLDTMRDYVNDHGGVASDDSNCLVVKPKWEELKEILKQGCDGLANELESFPCEQFPTCP